MIDKLMMSASASNITESITYLYCTKRNYREFLLRKLTTDCLIRFVIMMLSFKQSNCYFQFFIPLKTLKIQKLFNKIKISFHFDKSF